MTAARAVFIFLAALTLAGCGAQTEGVLIPQAGAPGATKVQMLVATTRAEELREPGVIFNGDRNRGVAYADLVVSIPPDANRKIGDVQWPASLPADPNKEFATLRADILDKKTAISQFHSEIKKAPNGRVLVFVHGYNTRFEGAVYRFAQIIHDSKAPAAPILFTWPSRGETLAYPYDRESALYSRDGLEDLLEALNADSNVKEIVILAHSMGNMVTLEALRTMALRRKGRGLAPKIREIMLAAPDVDSDVFRRQILDIGKENRPPITLFVSRGDDALKASRLFWGGVTRIGSINPNVEPYASAIKENKLIVIDLTDVKSDDSIGHSTFAASPKVVSAIGRSMASGSVLGPHGNTGLGDVIGSAALDTAHHVGGLSGAFGDDHR